MSTNKNFNMLLAGFGGQGILFAGKVIAYGGLMDEKEISWLPSYGPEMRGGTANCSVCISVEPGSIVIVDSFLINKKVERDDVTAFYVPATKIAEDNGLKGLANIILVGKLFHETNFCTEDALYKAVEKCVPPRKAHLIDANKKALQLGMEA